MPFDPKRNKDPLGIAELPPKAARLTQGLRSP
jgi:hypothetical protein